ncbi:MULTISPECIES: YigZ family protein [Lactobacillus]|uniref:YigZ family protein n=1 Tax=Lactobacillus TaxID=1578 RepID=UPI0018DE608B|nr:MULTISPECIES: YigZ family protein [unclassified Lactobacillus]MBI0121407.1 YigZ family protein [Lactobacillus sp. M0398]MBI0123554.1 YigZ family protein [Lactobacillus sp. W8174]MBI0135816.1 YigZ family protein [Lactobacillus sp. W8173]
MNEKENYLTIKENGNHKLTIKKSRFITTLIRTPTIEEAEKAIAAVSDKYRDATHNTFAYTIGLNDEHVKASDNGEPSGTAGVPELKALQLMKLKNVTAVVTRYFGGIKLGAGGLIRAYSNSVTKAVEAIGVVKRVQQQGVKFQVDYKKFDEIQHYLNQQKIFIDNIDYGVSVTISIYIDEGKLKELENDLTNILSGKIQFIFLPKRYNEVPITQHNYHDQ